MTSWSPLRERIAHVQMYSVASPNVEEVQTHKKRRYMDIHTDSTCKPFNDKIYIKNAKIHQCTDPSSEKHEGLQSSPEVFLKHD